jgi:hypothetical protein
VGGLHSRTQALAELAARFRKVQSPKAAVLRIDLAAHVPDRVQMINPLPCGDRIDCEPGRHSSLVDAGTLSMQPSIPSSSGVKSGGVTSATMPRHTW